MSGPDGSLKGGDPGEYVRRVHGETQQFTQDLLRENESLRGRIAALETEARSLLAKIEAGARQRSAHFQELEHQNFNLMNLYVASYRLHGTLDHHEVLATIQEILSNLVGAEELAVFALDDRATTLRLLRSQGLEHRRFESVRVGQGIIGGVVRSGVPFFAQEGDPGAPPGDEANLSACVPLRVVDRITGAIAVFRLLQQKSRLEAVDHELLNLLATHAAMALHCTELHARFCTRPERAA